MKLDDVSALLLGPGSDAGGKPPPQPLQAIAAALTRIAVALEAGASDAAVGTRMVRALESLAKDVGALRQMSERDRVVEKNGGTMVHHGPPE